MRELLYRTPDYWALTVLDSDGTYKQMEVYKDGNYEFVNEFTEKKDCESSMSSNVVVRDNENIVLGNAQLQKSNGTWKLTDLSGNALYDERYYTCLSAEATYLLVNEDNEVCVIDNKANMIIDYGVLTYDGDEIYYNGTRLDRDYYIPGDNGIAIVMQQEGESTVYFYSN